jgi:diketogulonate reductase-like aldo/keto reductase
MSLITKQYRLIADNEEAFKEMIYVKSTVWSIVLKNGYSLPLKGIGTYKLAPGDETYDAVKNALKHGARHIDTSIMYRNEKDVGRAIQDSNIPREDIFITAKLPPHIKNRNGAKRMFERTLKNLGVEYIDAYIINAPGPFDDLDGNYDEGNVEVYTYLEELYEQELVGAIGVSQFQVHHIENILKHCNIVPHINQISYFVGHTQDELVEYCRKNGIVIQGFSPLGKGYILTNPIIQKIANEYNVTTAQIALRYNLQKGVASIPKASSLNHIIENTSLDFILSAEAMRMLDAIDEDPRQYND